MKTAFFFCMKEYCGLSHKNVPDSVPKSERKTASGSEKEMMTENRNTIMKSVTVKSVMTSKTVMGTAGKT